MSASTAVGQGQNRPSMLRCMPCRYYSSSVCLHSTMFHKLALFQNLALVSSLGLASSSFVRGGSAKYRLKTCSSSVFCLAASITSRIAWVIGFGRPFRRLLSGTRVIRRNNRSVFFPTLLSDQRNSRSNTRFLPEIPASPSDDLNTKPASLALPSVFCSKGRCRCPRPRRRFLPP